MAKSKVTQERVEQTIEDAAYLQKEARALRYVIDEVPYNANPPEGYSIAELLMLINHAQFTYFEPIFDDAINNNRPTCINSFDHFKKTFTPEKRGDETIQELLHSLASRRAAFVNKLEAISLNDWQKDIYKNDKKLLLLELIEEMNHFDQVQLKKITNLVKSLHQEKSTQREIQQRRDEQLPKNNGA